MEAGPQWAIFDSAAIKREQWKIDENSGEEGYFFKADTLDELQEKLTQNPYQKFKLPKGRLAETVARYNAFVEKELMRTLTNRSLVTRSSKDRSMLHGALSAHMIRMRVCVLTVRTKLSIWQAK